MFDLLICNVCIVGQDVLVDIVVSVGFIVVIGLVLQGFVCEVIDVQGMFVFLGFVDSYIYLDKVDIFGCCMICEGILFEVIVQIVCVKVDFMVQDVYVCVVWLVECVILYGIMLMCSFVEVDLCIGFCVLDVLLCLCEDYCFVIDIQFCVFV